jgi:transcription antitermination protein NusB
MHRPTHGSRRRARSYALQVLFALDANPLESARGAVDRYLGLFDIELDPDSLQFAARLVEDTTLRREEIDGLIQRVSRNWRLERMSRVDRNILRMSTSELGWQDEVPTKVIINEAVELAKEFGAEESASFVNGLLDRIAHEVRPDPRPAS